MSDATKRSAFGVAALRYLGSFAADPAERNPDRLAGRVLPAHLRLIGRVRPLRAVVHSVVARRFPGVIPYHVARTRFIDEAVIDAVDRGVRQVAILGAGLDTRAHRLPALRRNGVKVTEFDFPDTSRRKRAALAAAGLTGGAQLVAVDLSREELRPLLERSGFDLSLPIFFIWEGVSMFLPADAVRGTLDVVAALPPGTAIVFDYVLDAVVSGEQDTFGSREARAYVEEGGEPWKFGFDPNTLPAFMDQSQLALVEHLPPDAIQQRLLPGVRSQVVGFHGLVHAAATGVASAAEQGLGVRA